MEASPLQVAGSNTNSSLSYKAYEHHQQPQNLQQHCRMIITHSPVTPDTPPVGVQAVARIQPSQTSGLNAQALNPTQPGSLLSPRHAPVLTIAPLQPSGTSPRKADAFPTQNKLLFNPASPGPAAQLLGNPALMPQPAGITGALNPIMSPALYTPHSTPASAPAAPAAAVQGSAFNSGALMPQGWALSGLSSSGQQSLYQTGQQSLYQAGQQSPLYQAGQISIPQAYQSAHGYGSTSVAADQLDGVIGQGLKPLDVAGAAPGVLPGSTGSPLAGSTNGKSPLTPGSAAAAAATFQAMAAIAFPPSVVPAASFSRTGASATIPDSLFGSRNGSGGSPTLASLDGPLASNARFSWDGADLFGPAGSGAVLMNLDDPNTDLNGFLDNIKDIAMQGDLAVPASLVFSATGPRQLLIHGDSLRRLSSQASQNVAANPGLSLLPMGTQEAAVYANHPHHAGMGVMVAPNRFRQQPYNMASYSVAVAPVAMAGPSATPEHDPTPSGSPRKSKQRSKSKPGTSNPVKPNGGIHKRQTSRQKTNNKFAYGDSMQNPGSPRLDGVSLDGLAEMQADGLESVAVASDSPVHSNSKSKRRAALNSRSMIRQYAADSYTADELQQYNSGSRGRGDRHSWDEAAAAASAEGTDDSEWKADGDESDASETRVVRRRRVPHGSSAVGLAEAGEVGGAAAAAVAAGRRGNAVGHSSTSCFKGVTRHRWTGKWEAHLWDAHAARKTAGSGGRTRGRQVYLGGYSSEEEAARAYDRAAIAYWGRSATTNYCLEDYADELGTLVSMHRDEVVQALRRGADGFARGASKFRGVSKHAAPGQPDTWEARIGGVSGNRYIYLGCFESEEEAARAYDRAAIGFKGNKAMTNFPFSEYFNLVNLGPNDEQQQERQQQFVDQEGEMLAAVQGEGAETATAEVAALLQQ